MTVYYTCSRLIIDNKINEFMTTKWHVHSVLFGSMNDLIIDIESRIDNQESYNIVPRLTEWAVFSHKNFNDRNWLVKRWYKDDHHSYYQSGKKLFAFTSDSFWYDSQQYLATL